jgi:hypothetical protein
MNSQVSCFKGALLLGASRMPLMLLGLLLLSACGSAPRVQDSAAGGEGSATGPGADLVTEQAAAKAAGAAGGELSGGGALLDPWSLGGPDLTLAIFPPFSGAESLRFGADERPISIYTYVLYGAAEAVSQQQARPWRHTELELLRLIETYVSADAETKAAPGRVKDQHAFLVPVYAGLDSIPLAERSAPELATAARQALAARLDAGDQPALASRLRAAPGPFLISRTSAQLLSPQTDAPLLLTDLSSIGAEYLYPVVDAYDRPVSSASAGSERALSELHQRLAALAAPEGLAASNHWVYLLDTKAVQAAKAKVLLRGS